jgi:hypothetical protein
VARGEPSNLDSRLLKLLDPSATVADAFDAANELYRTSTLPPVTDLEVFQGAYLPGRAPNAARSAHAQTSQEQPQQTQAGADGQSQEREQGEQEQEQDQNAETGGEQSGEREKQVPSEGKSAGSRTQSMARTQPQERGGQGGDKGTAYPEWDYREGRYKRNWSWVPGKAPGRIEPRRSEPAHLAVRARVKTPEKGDPGAETDPARAEAAAIRRRRYRHQRGRRLRRRAARRHVAAGLRSTVGAKSSSATCR